MCGRFVLLSDWENIAREFDLNRIDKNLPATGDIQPGQESICVIRNQTSNVATVLLWGFLPPPIMQKPGSKLLINARAETIDMKPMFHNDFRQRRCLIVADGFYEWTKEKKAFYFYLKSGKPFGLAGIYESAMSGIAKKSFVIITTRPNELIAPLHDRMPVMIPADKRSLWLDNTKYDKDTLQSLFVPYPAEEMTMHPAELKTGHLVYH
jgi:putative SOS response-associated peptidase YedK